MPRWRYLHAIHGSQILHQPHVRFMVCSRRRNTCSIILPHLYGSMVDGGERCQEKMSEIPLLPFRVNDGRLVRDPRPSSQSPLHSQPRPLAASNPYIAPISPARTSTTILKFTGFHIYLGKIQPTIRSGGRKPVYVGYIHSFCLLKQNPQRSRGISVEKIQHTFRKWAKGAGILHKIQYSRSRP